MDNPDIMHGEISGSFSCGQGCVRYFVRNGSVLGCGTGYVTCRDLCLYYGTYNKADGFWMFSVGDNICQSGEHLIILEYLFS